LRKRLTNLLSGLSKTREALRVGIRTALGRGPRLDDEALADIEEALIAADLGVDTAARLVEALKAEQPAVDAASGEGVVRDLMARELLSILEGLREAPERPSTRPLVIMVVGVNGVGKTTTIGKLARRLGVDGQSVVLAAADTFRAAAGSQLSTWADRSGAHFVAGQHGGDPAAVAYDALDSAIARSADALIVDTAGRLHTRGDLMKELEKIQRVLGKRLPGAPHEVLLVLDANTGQNALSQARLFHEAVGVTDIALAKLDGTARGGIVVAIARELAIPVRYVGTGESIDDLVDFDARAFVEGIVGTGSGDPA